MTPDELGRDRRDDVAPIERALFDPRMPANAIGRPDRICPRRDQAGPIADTPPALLLYKSCAGVLM